MEINDICNKKVLGLQQHRQCEVVLCYFIKETKNFVVVIIELQWHSRR